MKPLLSLFCEELKNPEDYYPENFDTPLRANALMSCLMQDAAIQIQQLSAENEGLRAQVEALTKPQALTRPDVPDGLPELFREALAWGKVWGAIMEADLWDEMRERMVSEFTKRAAKPQPSQQEAVQPQGEKR